jgi:hypothetical protein
MPACGTKSVQPWDSRRWTPTTAQHLDGTTSCVGVQTPTPAGVQHGITICATPAARQPEKYAMHKKTPLTDVQTLRARARANIDDGAVTTGYTADRATVLRLLDEPLATEVLCVLRYRRHYFMARGIHS